MRTIASLIAFCLINLTAHAATVKTINGLAIASVKTVKGLATASVKTVNGLATSGGGGGASSFTITQTEGEEASGSATTIAAVVEGVAAGSLIVVYVTHEGAATTITVSDGDAYTARTKVTASAAGNDLHGQFFYILTSSSGDRTITATFAAARAFRSITAVVATYTGAAAYDTEPSGGGTSGSSTAINSGNFTTTGTVGLIVGGYGPYSGNTTSAPLINGVAAGAAKTANDDISDPYNAGALIWARVTSGTFTGAASATLGGSDVWMCNAVAFK